MLVTNFLYDVPKFRCPSLANVLSHTGVNLRKQQTPIINKSKSRKIVMKFELKIFDVKSANVINK